jgi:hypothetical protein
MGANFIPSCEASLVAFCNNFSTSNFQRRNEELLIDEGDLENCWRLATLEITLTPPSAGVSRGAERGDRLGQNCEIFFLARIVNRDR